MQKEFSSAQEGESESSRGFARKQRHRLPASAGCEACRISFRPKNPGQRFCSQVCYHRWWRDEVRPKATQAGVTAIKKAIKEGKGPNRDGYGRFHAPKPGPPSRVPRRACRLNVADVVDHPAEVDDESVWAERAEYWGSLTTEPKARPTPFGPTHIERQPLVLNGHGVYLRIHQGALVIRNGFTHYPQANPELRFFRAGKDLPSRIVVLDCDGAISFDVIEWLSEQDIPLVILNWRGDLVSVVVGDHGAYDPELRELQLAALTNGNGLRLAKELIRRKFEACRDTLATVNGLPGKDPALLKLENSLSELEAPIQTIDSLRLTEGRAALAYFTCWQDLPLRWKGIGRKPIPDEWHRCGTRQGLLGSTNRHATHPVNALLNYSYSILESRVRIAAVSEGFDATIGYLHSNHSHRLSLVYDLMEPLRPSVDRLVLQFVNEHTLSPSDFTMTKRGVCRLHPDLAGTFVRQLSEGTLSIPVVLTAVIDGLTRTSVGEPG